MQSELTLHLDAELIAKVERWAEARNLTLSDAIATLLNQLPDQDQALKLTPWTQQLVGVLVSVEDADGEGTLQEQYVDYLEDKYPFHWYCLTVMYCWMSFYNVNLIS